ncbi:MAG TPA: MFS transporter [Thermoanaerobaculia bacterium]|nr:MFS transporter [Thermoanaerobaculia bacterium]
MRERLTRVFKAFTYRDFSLLWAGAFTSSVGTWMQSVAQSWLVLTISKNPQYLAWTDALQQAPFLALSLVGGVLADRMDRRRILLLSQVVQLSSAFLLAFLVYTHRIEVWVILVLAFVVGVATSFGGPAYQALVPTLVDREDLPNAVALNSIQFNLARVIGPVLAGAAFATLGAAACFGLNGLSFFAVIVAILMLRRGAPTGAASGSVLDNLKAGLAASHGDRALRGLIALSFIGSLLAFPLLTFLPVIAKDVFRGDVKDFSILLAIFGLGAVVGALGTAGFGHVRRRGAVAVAMQMTLGALMIGFGLSRTKWLSYVLLFGAGAALMIVFAMFMTLVQTSVDDAMRGRVVSVYSLAFRGAMPLGSVLAGFLVGLMPAPWVLVGNGALLLLVGTTVFLRNHPEGVPKL